ncbi:hypothetical protein EV700_2710 [Fluviicoccus keumensis]|uniref:DUF2059 domain-containing protein n=1 Tax=Fluviicoccus keumensis TaxID=1435465 RepID=A0A4Q7YMT5_9GAMM|nr:hypothetical protein [Fluviicoccus keumensis]RZU38133.1 hypothetical protein EV700_2710 [Fluviicoccus keumensis]
MRRLFALTVLFACLTPLPSPVQAAAAPVTTVAGQEQVSQLMDKSGLRAALRNFSAYVGQSLRNPDQPGVSPELARRMAAKVDIAFAPGFLDQAVKDDLAARLSADDVRRLLAWHDTALGARVTALEITSSDRLSTVILPPAAPPVVSAARQKLLDRVMKATNAAEMLVDVQIQVMTAMFRGMASTAAMSGNNVDIAPILKEMSDRRAELLAQVKPETMDELRTTYAPLSDADLKQYVVFLESPLGRKFNRAVVKSLQSALTESGDTFGQLLLGSP